MNIRKIKEFICTPKGKCVLIVVIVVVLFAKAVAFDTGESVQMADNVQETDAYESVPQETGETEAESKEITAIETTQTEEVETQGITTFIGADTEETEVGEAETEPTVEGLAISGEYDSYGRGYMGLIPVSKDGFTGLVNYDNEVIVPLEYVKGCNMVNEGGYSYFINDTGSRVFDKNGKEVFYTEKTICGINDDVIYIQDGEENNSYVAYYNINGTLLYETGEENYYSAGTVFNEGYAFFKEFYTQRIDGSGVIETMEYVGSGKEIPAEETLTQEVVASNMNINTEENKGLYIETEEPIGALNEGYYISKGILYEEVYGHYILRDIEHTEEYLFDIRSLFDRVGINFDESDAEWGLQGFLAGNQYFFNKGTLICVYIVGEEGVKYYLIDVSEIETEFSAEDAVTHENVDMTVPAYQGMLTDKAILMEADSIYLSDEKYWLFKTNDEWGYIDHDGNVINMYEDASAFNNGKAVVIDGGMAYLIDEDFKKLYELEKAAAVDNYGELFNIVTQDFPEGKLIDISREYNLN